MGVIRTFIALETPEADRKLLSSIQSQLQEGSSDVKWESEDKFHTTVKFLGDTDENRIHRLSNSMKSVLAAFHPFSLTYDSVGFFPNWQSPKVVWVGSTEPVPIISQIKTKLDKELAQMGFEIEKRAYHPHITMGRIKGENGIEHLLSRAENLTFEPITMQINEFVLMKSILRPEGSQYFMLEKFTLGT